MNIFGKIDKNYWEEQADKLIRDLQSGAINRDVIAMGLECTYCAGVIDATLFTQEQKKDMYDTLKKVYDLGLEEH